MKKIIRILAAIFALLGTAYGVYSLVNRFMVRSNRIMEESCEFDDLYNEYVATYGEKAVN